MIYAPYSKLKIYISLIQRNGRYMIQSIDAISICYSLKRRDEGSLFDLTLKRESGRWTLTGSTGGGCICSDSEAINRVIDENIVATLIEKLSTISVPPLVLQDNSIEEGFEVLTITKGIFQSRFSWDENAPGEYEKLQKIGKKLQSWIR